MSNSDKEEDDAEKGLESNESIGEAPLDVSSKEIGKEPGSDIITIVSPTDFDDDSGTVAVNTKSNCKTNKNGVRPSNLNSNSLNEVPRVDILTLRTPTSIDLLRQALFKFPEEAIPPFGRNRWYGLPVGGAIAPLNTGGIPSNVVYSRGRVGTSLISKKAPKFTIHEERVLKSPYTALHDPGVLSYCLELPVRTLLIQKGLISQSGLVLCSLKEIQQYYDYLSSVANSFVNDYFEEQNERYIFEKQQTKILLQAKREINRGKQEIMCLPTIIKPKQSSTNNSADLELDKLRILALQKKKEWEQIRRLEKSLEQDMKLQLFRAKVSKKDKEKRRQILLKITLKEITAFLKRQNNEEELKNFKQQRNLDWITMKSEASSARVEREQALILAVMEDRHKRAEQRQEKAQRHEHDFAKWAEKRKASVWALARKYFYIWLNKTRERIKQRKLTDPSHQSSFIGQPGKPDPAAQVVMDLGYLKNRGWADFIKSIIQLRNSTKNPEFTLLSTPSIDSVETTQSMEAGTLTAEISKIHVLPSLPPPESEIPPLN